MAVYFDISPTENAAIVVHCDTGLPAHQDVNHIDVRDLIHASLEEFTQDLITFNRGLISSLKPNIQRWNFSPISRLLVWPNAIGGYRIRNIYIAQAINKLARTTSDDICVIGAEAPVSIYVSQLSGDAYNVGDAQAVKNTGASLRYFINLSRSVASTFLAYFRNRRHTPGCDAKPFGGTLVLSTIFRTNPNEYSDHFFGKLLKDTENGSSDITWIFDNPDTQQAELTAPGLETQLKYNFLFSQMSLADIVRSIALDLRQHVSMRTFKRKHAMTFEHQGGRSRAIADDFILNLGLQQTSFTQFLTYFLVARYIARHQPKNLIYPYEGKLNEAALLAAVRDSSTEITSVGFAHAAYTKGHMFTQFFDLIPENIPEKLAVTGKEAGAFFQRNGIAKSKIVVVGTDRFHQVDAGSPGYFSHEGQKPGLRKKLRVLFISSLGFEYVNFAKLLVQHPEIATRFDVSIRSSYHSWHEERLIGDGILAEGGISVGRADGSLREEILSSDVVLFEYTTAAYQASLLGRLIVKVRLYETFETDHISPGGGTVPLFSECILESDLLNVLSEVSKSSLKDYELLASEQRRAIARIYQPRQLSHIRKLVNAV